MGAPGDRSAACCAPSGQQDECTRPACAASNAHTPASATCIATGALAAAAPSGTWSIWSIHRAGRTCLPLPGALAAAKVVLMPGAAIAPCLAACGRALAARSATSVASPKRALSCAPRDVPRAQSHMCVAVAVRLSVGPSQPCLPHVLEAAGNHLPLPLLSPLTVLLVPPSRIMPSVLVLSSSPWVRRQQLPNTLMTGVQGYTLRTVPRSSKVWPP